MKIGERGLELIKSFETLELEAYPDPGTGGEPWTIGWGHTGGVRPGDTCTEEQADAWLEEDVATAERAINRLVKVKLTQNQFDALCSLIYNIGVGAFEKSTLLRKLNFRDFLGAAAEFKRWNKSGGRVMKGLTRRRLAEEKLFLLA